MAVILNAPAVLRYTAHSNPERHIHATRLLGADVSDVGPGEAGDVLSDRIIHILKKMNAPNGLSELGYTDNDIPALVKGTLPQHRVTKLTPRETGPEDLGELFSQSMRLW